MHFVSTIIIRAFVRQSAVSVCELNHDVFYPPLAPRELLQTNDRMCHVTEARQYARIFRQSFHATRAPNDQALGATRARQMRQSAA